MTRYEVVLKKWVDGSGFQYEETVDWVSGYSAEEYLENLEEPLYSVFNRKPGEDTLVEVRDHYDQNNIVKFNVVSEFWAKEFYGLD